MDYSRSAFTEREFEGARSRLFKNIDKDRNLRDQLGSAAGWYMPEDLADTVFYNASFVRNSWPGCDMTSMVANGSDWVKAQLLECDLVKTTMQNSKFLGCDFVDCRIEASNFANSAFFSTAFENARIDGCSFVGAEFESSLMTGCSVSDSTFELCRFKNTTIEDIRFGNVNMCYASLDGAKLDSVELPFFQLPYTFFGLQRLEEFSGSTRVATLLDASISADEYLSYLPDFVVYLSHEHDYFPLVNCLEMLGEHEIAIERCLEGLRSYRAEHDYRMLYHLCLLATRVLCVGDGVRREIADIVDGEQDTDSCMSRGDQFQFSKYFPRVKHILLDNPQGKISLDISFQTDVPADDYSKLSAFMQEVEVAMAAADVKIASKHLEVRHNSPFLVDMMMFGSPQDFLALANSLMSLSAPMTGELIAEAEAAVEQVVTSYGTAFAAGAGLTASVITIAEALSKVGAKIRRHFSPDDVPGVEAVRELRLDTDNDGRISRFESRREDFARLRDRVREIEKTASRATQDAGSLPAFQQDMQAPSKGAAWLHDAEIGIKSVRVRVIDEI